MCRDGERTSRSGGREPDALEQADEPRVGAQGRGQEGHLQEQRVIVALVDQPLEERQRGVELAERGVHPRDHERVDARALDPPEQLARGVAPAGRRVDGGDLGAIASTFSATRPPITRSSASYTAAIPPSPSRRTLA
jgi:hypothetical protein